LLESRDESQLRCRRLPVRFRKSWIGRTNKYATPQAAFADRRNPSGSCPWRL